MSSCHCKTLLNKYCPRMLTPDSLSVNKVSSSGVTESLFWGAKGGGADLRLGGGQEDGITMIFVHKQKSNGGRGNGGHSVNGGRGGGHATGFKIKLRGL